MPAGPINTVAEALEEPQVEARGLRIAPEGIPGLRTPISFSRSPPRPRHRLAGAGERSLGVCSRAGLGGRPVMTIQAVGVIGAGQMGNGIAHVFSLAGYEVLLNDISARAWGRPSPRSTPTIPTARA